MNEVAKQEAPAHPMVQFKRDMEAMVARELEMLDDKARSRLKSAAIVAVTKDPDLLLADRQSFMGAIRMCAQHGVTPDGNEATLQVYNTKVKNAQGQEIWVKKVTYLPMIRGIINRVMRSGKVRLFYAEVVYADETFRVDLSKGDRRPVHDYDPMRRGVDKDIVGAYSVAVFENDITDLEPMPRDEIDKVRASAKTQKVWDGWFSEKAKVAVMKRHSKRLPLSAEDMDFILNRDETDFDQSPRDITPEDKPRGPNLAQRLAVSSTPDQTTEPLTGEIMPEELPAGQVVDGVAGPHWAIGYKPKHDGFPTDVFAAGRNAAAEGQPVTVVPHAKDSPEADEWIAGWQSVDGEAA